MEGLLLVVVSLLGLAVFVAPLLSIVGFLRTRAMRARLDELARTVDALDQQLRELTRRPAPPPDQAARTSAEDARTTAPAQPAVGGAPARPGAVPPADGTGSRDTGVTVSRAVPSPQSPPPLPPTPQQSAPPASPATAPPPPPEHALPPPPPAPPSEPAFDWESLLGIRGAAWLGGVTLVIAALFFAKWSIDQGFFSPVIRVALMLLAGTGALVWAEVNLRRGYQTTANAVSGAGIVILYVAFVAGHSLYQLFSLPVAFVAMSLVTLTAAVIAIRLHAFFTAAIGLVGGLATPVLLSSGVDRPVTFFSYLTLLAVGFLFVAERRGWPSISVLAVIGTTSLELAWYMTNATPEKLAVGSAAFFALGAAYLWHAVRTRAGTDLSHYAGIAGSLVPLGFALLIAADPRFVPRWEVGAAFLVAVDLGLVVTGMTWQLPVLVGTSATGTGLVLLLQGETYSASATGVWGLSAAAILMAAGYNLLPRLATRWRTEWIEDGRQLALLAGGLPLTGLVGFAWLTSGGAYLPLWAFIAMMTTALCVLVERTRLGHWPGVFAAGTFAMATSCAHWVASRGEPGTYLDSLTIPHLLATVVAIIVVWRQRQLDDPSLDWWQTDRVAIVGTAGVAYWAAVNGLQHVVQPAPAPYFALLALDVGLVLAVAIRAAWTALVPAAAAASLVFAATWHERHFDPAAAAPSVAAYGIVYGVFLLLPFVVTRRVDPSWQTRPAPWLASALIGPASFLLFYDTWIQLAGRTWVGIVPVLMAAVSVAALYGVSREFQEGADEQDARRRLNYLALFAAIALGFIATAVPLQLERQWITIGWALEAAAVWWLFGLLPHPGLKYFGLLLYTAVGLRLLVNVEVLTYQPRGRPIVNWLLYTYGVPALCCLVGAWLIRGAERRRGASPDFDYTPRDRAYPAALVGFLGVLIGFWLINLEIADYYSVGRYVEFDFSRHLARDLTRSFAWGLYALALLAAGLWRVNRGLRLVSLGFLLLTVAKVFLYDLGQLTGLYRIVSFLALGLSLILVSLLYQRFVRRVEATA